MNIAQIAAKAMNAAQGAITDAVHVATVTRMLQGVYDAASDTYDGAAIWETGRAVSTGASPRADMFPAYVIGPQDQAFMLEGFTTLAENDVLVVNGVSRTIMAVQDVGGAGTLFNVIAR
jgi:hypothetical protein